MEPMPSIGAAELVVILAVSCLCLLVLIGAGVGVYFLVRGGKKERE
jgi:hypothetical protein